MKVQIKNDNRALILRILQDQTGHGAEYHPMPEFSYTVGPYTLTRKSYIEADADHYGLFPVLAALGMCEYPCEAHVPEEAPFCYSTENHSSLTLLNLISIVSARQSLLNRALDSRNAFYVAPSLMGDLLAHPPTTIPDFLQALYGRDDEYKGLAFTLSYFSMTGFLRCRPEEAKIHDQLARRIINAAATQKWAKAFTPRVRNQKYAFRTWLNSIGMTGPEFETARLILLSRLPGRADQRRIPVRKEA